MNPLPVGIDILYRSIVRAHRHNPRNQPQIQYIPDTRFNKRIPPLPTQRYQCQHTRFPRPGFTLWSMDPQLSRLVHEVAYPRQSSCCIAGEVDDGLGIYIYVCMPNADIGEEQEIEDDVQRGFHRADQEGDVWPSLAQLVPEEGERGGAHTYLSKARVAQLTAKSIAPNTLPNAEILTYVILSFLTSMGTKVSVNLCAALAIITDISIPNTA